MFFTRMRKHHHRQLVRMVVFCYLVKTLQPGLVGLRDVVALDGDAGTTVASAEAQTRPWDVVPALYMWCR